MEAPRGSPWRTRSAAVLAATSDHPATAGEATTFNLANEVFLLGLLLYAVREAYLGLAVIGAVFTAAALAHSWVPGSARG